MTKWVYLFNEGNKDMRDLLGGKGAGLAEMTRAGLPVPSGFTITTECCVDYFEQGGKFPASLKAEGAAAVHAGEGIERRGEAEGAGDRGAQAD